MTSLTRYTDSHRAQTLTQGISGVTLIGASIDVKPRQAYCIRIVGDGIPSGICLDQDYSWWIDLSPSWHLHPTICRWRRVRLEGTCQTRSRISADRDDAVTVSGNVQYLWCHRYWPQCSKEMCIVNSITIMIFQLSDWSKLALYQN